MNLVNCWSSLKNKFAFSYIRFHFYFHETAHSPDLTRILCCALVALQRIPFHSAHSKLWINTSWNQVNTSCNVRRIIASLSGRVERTKRHNKTTKRHNETMKRHNETKKRHNETMKRHDVTTKRERRPADESNWQFAESTSEIGLPKWRNDESP